MQTKQYAMNLPGGGCSMEKQDIGPQGLSLSLLKREAGGALDQTRLAQAADRILHKLSRLFLVGHRRV